jgi:hypothetical protein
MLLCTIYQQAQKAAAVQGVHVQLPWCVWTGSVLAWVIRTHDGVSLGVGVFLPARQAQRAKEAAAASL